MTENRFFIWVWRFNGLAIAIAVTLIIGIIIWELSRDWRKQTFPTQTREVLNVEPTNTSEDGNTLPEVKETLRFGTPILSKVHGTYAVPQYAEQEYDNLGISKSSGGNRVNFLIVDIQDKSQNWLFPPASRLILDVRELGYTSPTGSRTLIGRVLEVVHTDTNQDGRLSGNDLSSLYFVNPQWEQPNLLVNGVDYILSTETRSASAFDIMYVGKKASKLLHFRPPFAKPAFEITLNDAP